MDKHGEATSRLSKRIRRTDGAHYITRWPMDRDGRWNRGRGHARVPGDCSHWLENRVKRGETWQGFGGRGENRGWPMSINGSPSTACLPFSPPLFLPVHNNFDSRVIIAFSKNKSFRKNISIILGIAIPNHFFFIRWLHLFLTRTFCLSASFFVSVFFFSYSPRFHFTSSLSVWFQRLITFFFVSHHDPTLFHF